MHARPLRQDRVRSVLARGGALRTASSTGQLKLWTDRRLNDRLNCAEGRTQGTLEVVPLGQELR